MLRHYLSVVRPLLPTFSRPLNPTSSNSLQTSFPLLQPLSNNSRLFSTVPGSISSVSSNYFSYEIMPNGVAIVSLDDKSNKINTLSSKLLNDFTKLLEFIKSSGEVKSVVFISGKKDSFIAGADITELGRIVKEEDGREISRLAQKHLNDLSELKKPTVAAINGSCLGGGLEFALACDYRICTSSPKTVLGLPEVKLGLLPGAGGTQRLQRLIGIQNAIQLTTTGSNTRADKALRLGLVDEVADPFALKHAAVSAAERLQNLPKAQKKTKFNFMKLVLEQNAIGRNILFSQARKMAKKSTGGKYPAVELIIDTIEAGANKGFEAGLKEESLNFGKLTITPESKALQNLFFASTALKKNIFAKLVDSEKMKNFNAKQDKTVAILGAGLMGAGIAQISAVNGCHTIVKDVQSSFLKRGENQIVKNLSALVAKRRMTKFDFDSTMSRLDFLTSDEQFAQKLRTCDYVIEAVLEDISLKHKVLNGLTQHFNPDSPPVIATNTSALSVNEIANGINKFKENVLGMHYFSPVDKMPLLEIIPSQFTSNETKFKAVDLGLKQKKTVIVVKDVPGFYVNRCLGPYLSEVIDLINEGVNIIDIDKAMKSYGFPVGPISLIDEVGLDVVMHVQTTLNEDGGLRARMSEAKVLKELIDLGNKGRKSGKGFFDHKSKTSGKGKSKEMSPEAAKVLGSSRKELKAKDQEQAAKRMAYKFINEAALCLQHEVINSPADGDIGAVFGVGFPPFKGGPFKEIDRMGAETFVQEMKSFEEKHGERFKVAEIIIDKAKAGGKFYS